MVSGLADVQAEEHAHVFDLEHRTLPWGLTVPASARVSCSRIHVMQTCRPRTVRHCAGPDGGRTSDQRLRRTPPGPGDTTPQVMPSTGGHSHAGPRSQRSRCRTAKKITGACYLRGLMLDGRRKSIKPMAERLPDGNMQALQQFVNQSPWNTLPVRRRIARRSSRPGGVFRDATPDT